jgi:outer membrane protein OmpA-like peptidoglycan-associated protein
VQIEGAKGSARLDANDKAQLRAAATRLKTTLAPVYVTGHAGAERGAAASLSLQRARTVAQYLSAQGVRVWIRFDGIGDQHAKGRPSDRRAEIRAT